MKPATHLAISYDDRGEFDRKRFSLPIDANTLGDFFRRSRQCGSFEKSYDKIAQPDGFALMAIRSNDRSRGVVTCTHIRTCVPEKVENKIK